MNVPALTVGVTAASLLGGCGSADIRGTIDVPPYLDCAPGVEIVVEAWASTPCDLDGSQALTLTWDPSFTLARVREWADNVGCGPVVVTDAGYEAPRCDY
jgi:hypothetical protein